MCALLPATPVEKTFQELEILLLQQVQPEKLATAARYDFSRMEQGSDNMWAFVRKLKSSAEDCQFGQRLEECIRDQLVFELSSQEALKEMLTKKLADLTLKRVVEVAEAFEMVQNKQKMWNVEKDMDVCRVFKSQKNDNVTSETQPSVSGSRGCACGKLGHAKQFCKFRNKTWHVCKKLDIWKRYVETQQNYKMVPKVATVSMVRTDDNFFTLGKG